jgi:hypothetical protein
MARHVLFEQEFDTLKIICQVPARETIISLLQ